MVVERRPVGSACVCSFKRIGGGSAYQKNLLSKLSLYVLHPSAASLPDIRVPRQLLEMNYTNVGSWCTFEVHFSTQQPAAALVCFG